jgi:hypothetical protein
MFTAAQAAEKEAGLFAGGGPSLPHRRQKNKLHKHHQQQRVHCWATEDQKWRQSARQCSLPGWLRNIANRYLLSVHCRTDEMALAQLVAWVGSLLGNRKAGQQPSDRSLPHRQQKHGASGQEQKAQSSLPHGQQKKFARRRQRLANRSLLLAANGARSSAGCSPPPGG